MSKNVIFWMDFVVGNSNKLQGLEGKLNWALNVFTLPNLDIFNSKNVKKKKVFTLGPMTQAILITMKKGFQKVRQC